MDEAQEYYSLARSTFDKLAPYYDALIVPLAGVRQEVVNLANPTDGAAILDVATGTGAQAFAFARRGYDVVGVDLCEAMLEVAQKKSRYPNLRFEIGDAANLQFDNNSFDISCISFALHLMPPPIREKTLGEMRRVTRPSGNIVIADLALPGNRIGRFLIDHLFQTFDDRHYREFLKSDLEGLLGRMEIKVIQEHRLLFGGVKIVLGAKA